MNQASKPPFLRMQEEVLFFHDLGDPLPELSSFYPTPFTLDGATWPTVEHYFQAQKFVHLPDLVARIRQVPSALDAFNVGRENSASRRADWREVRLEVMGVAVAAKFQQNPGARKVLLETGEAQLVEHTQKDRFWGDGGGPGQGENHLGKILMALRARLLLGMENA